MRKVLHCQLQAPLAELKERNSSPSYYKCIILCTPRHNKQMIRALKQKIEEHLDINIEAITILPLEVWRVV